MNITNPEWLFFNQPDKFITDIYSYELVLPIKGQKDINIYVNTQISNNNDVDNYSVVVPHLTYPSLSCVLTYQINCLRVVDINNVNNILKKDVYQGLSLIEQLGGSITFYKMKNTIDHNSLCVIHPDIPWLLAHMLMYCIKEGISSLYELIKQLTKYNPLSYQYKESYLTKIKRLIVALVLGFNLTNKWQGIRESQHGYLVIDEKGDFSSYDIDDLITFNNYLLTNSTLTMLNTEDDPANVYINKLKIVFDIPLNIDFNLT